MPSQPDAHSIAICWLFKALATSMDEPDEHDWKVRDAHWFANLELRDWQEHQRNYEGAKFFPLPWYREKAVCSRAVASVGTLFEKKSNHLPPHLFTSEDKAEIWKILRACIQDEAEKEYIEYAKVMSQRYADPKGGV